MPNLNACLDFRSNLCLNNLGQQCKQLLEVFVLIFNFLEQAEEI